MNFLDVYYTARRAGSPAARDCHGWGKPAQVAGRVYCRRVWVRVEIFNPSKTLTRSRGSCGYQAYGIYQWIWRLDSEHLLVLSLSPAPRTSCLAPQTVRCPPPLLQDRTFPLHRQDTMLAAPQNSRPMHHESPRLSQPTAKPSKTCHAT